LRGIDQNQLLAGRVAPTENLAALRADADDLSQIKALVVRFHVFASEAGIVTDNLESYSARMAEVAAQRLAQVQDAAAAAGVSCDIVHAQNEHPYQAIIDVATSRGCDLIVVASHGRCGISAFVLGSEAVKVLTHSTIPVLVYRGTHSTL